ncbi:hypothetical protein CVT26_009053 [Gymnopilus dilepis]|uniref:Reverse transcriptase domain-containing protein n=1 Tax=Gymnopilus dilepis TaxID=231916 RepID=A0A409YAZ4_9AGAR|nr:hypothetical protein CVT26_009053 [Gymnopilus dilepis]
MQELEVGSRSSAACLRLYPFSHENNHAAGPFKSPPLQDFRCSPLGVVGRKRNPGKLRVINHLSWPDGSSVNDNIPDSEASISYDAFECAVRDFVASGPGSLMAKLDLKDAFRHIPIRALDWNLLGFHWGCRFYFLLVLAFGLKTAPYIFNLFAEALHWIIQRHIPAALRHYLDDFLLIFPAKSPQPICNAAIEWTMALGRELGLCFQDSKTVWPSTKLEFLGIELDSITMEARLLPDKLEYLQQLVGLWAEKQKCSLRDLQELTGFLQFASQVVPCARSFLWRLFDFFASFRSQFALRHIPSSARADIAWWSRFSAVWNGVRLLRQIDREPLHIFTDASGRKGLGGVYGDRWFSSRTPRRFRNRDIQFKEGRSVIFFCDNQDVVSWLNSGTSRSAHAMPIRMHKLMQLLVCASSTRKTYSSGQKSFVEFARLNPQYLDTPGKFLPASPRILLERVIRGIKRFHGEKDRKPKLPITLDILQKLAGVPGDLTIAGNASFDAAIKLAWAGFLRCGEFTLNSGEKFNSAVHLTRGSVTFLPSFEQPDYIRLDIPASKTDPFRKGVSLLISAVPGASTCPVTALKRLCTINPQPTDAPLFADPSGAPLSRNSFISLLKSRLTALGFDASLFAGHSFRHGAASAAAAVGYAEHEIQLLGRWRSDAYKLYIDVPRDRILGLSAHLHGAALPAQLPVPPSLHLAASLA